LPSRIKVKKNSKPLIRNDYTPLQRSLFEFVEEEKFNDTEKSVALYLDEQEKLLWWYRNISRQDYYLQGWKKIEFIQILFSQKLIIMCKMIIVKYSLSKQRITSKKRGY